MGKVTYYPTTSSRSGPTRGPGALYTKSTKCKQLLPHDSPASYMKEISHVHAGGWGISKTPPARAFSDPGFDPGIMSGPIMCLHTNALFSNKLFTPYRQACINRANGKFQKSLRDQVQLLVNWAERKQAIDSLAKLTNRVDDTLYDLADLSVKALTNPRQFVRDIVARLWNGRGSLKNFKRAAREAAQRWRAKGEAGISKLSDFFLELNFGWIPLIEDIGTAITILNSDPPPDSVKVKSRLSFKKVNKENYTSSAWWQSVTDGQYHVTMGATISSVNERLFKLDTWGALNPVQFVWQIATLSFVVDWFYNVNQFLASWTGRLAFTLTNVYTTVWAKATMVGGYYEAYGARYCYARSSNFRIDRTLSLLPVKFQRQMFEFGVFKAAVTFSLIEQRLRKLT